MLLDRQLLLGVGIGLLLGATLTAVGGGHQRSLSRMEIVSRAKALGMTFKGEERLDFGGPAATSQAPAAAAPPSEAPAATSPAPPAATASAGPAPVVPKQTAAAAAKSEAKPAPAAPPAPKKVAPKVTPAPAVTTLTVVVPPGATAGEVARLLISKSLIVDEGEFLHMAQVKQAEARFLPGTYRFRSDVTVKSLIASLLSGQRAQ